jgi:tetratricopeptide (TPR) repeat protein
LTFQFPKGLAQSHPVEVELEIDTDKKSRWRFRPKGFDWSDAKEAANPWIDKEPSENVKRLQKTREEIRKAVDAGLRPPVWMLADEALHAARAGYTEEGLALAEDLIEANRRTFDGWHVKGLIHFQRGEYRQSLESYEEASALAPTNMVTRGNLGATLVRLKRYQEAIAVMREALSKDPSVTYLHWWLAEAFQALQNIEEMNKELEMHHAHAKREAVRRSGDLSAWDELRSAALRIGRYVDAEEASETIRELRRPRNLLAGAKHG